MDSLAAAEYISTGGNRHSAASDWSSHSGILAYGADQNIALWRPIDEDVRGIYALLNGHGAKVTAIRFLKEPNDHDLSEIIVSGSADGEVRIWTAGEEDQWSCTATVKGHEGAVNCIATSVNGELLATGGADSVIKLWRWQDGGLTLVSATKTQPRFIPLSLALGHFRDSASTNSAFLVAGGTRNDVYVYALNHLRTQPEVKHCATLSGHEGWIRCLSLRSLKSGAYLLASTSADKYVRLWKFSSGEEQPNGIVRDNADIAVDRGSLTAKVQTVSADENSFAITFEALLLGHEDWVYSAAWNPSPESEQLLTASADGSLTIWEPDPSSGIWVSVTRLGEISGQKGATTATGSAGGFWNALWSPEGNAVTCLGRTGGWRLWIFDLGQQYWTQKTAVTGHVGSANGISWAPNGSYLLSTGSDQTTRLHAEWRRGTKRTWHEFARPQIHGYDLNCVSSTTGSQFASGADEKLLRVFDEPKSTARLLERLCRVQEPQEESLPEVASIPVLGLSNKAMDEAAGIDDAPESNGFDQAPVVDNSASFEQLQEPPAEDLLARHTLWPEREKLYGHGYEISESASNGHTLATACKASSLDHAVIRLYDTTTWDEIRPPLSAHTLTVTRLAWSPGPDSLLLSVGRDRQWAIFKQTQASQSWQLLQSNPKAHSRMILDAAWCPEGSRVFFATAGRDKSIKLWAQEQPDKEFALSQTISRKTAVTAVAITATSKSNVVCLAAGEDDGTMSVHLIDAGEGMALVGSLTLPARDCPATTVNRLAWRLVAPSQDKDGPGIPLAVASADSSVRILRIDVQCLIDGVQP
ncbi:uncharacterized protein HMPREF1541_04777 [Cyphellophora europaea CBS 101466]|uniref:Elongator complex protein 2 n=1 Tax=Cyphellophora europaea (strain CBS 101466) TaxID=1220924 RepID=W2RW07_CYPE1|nr:uncharacterized protein HMPREF1541_04777 [Cyphellophora europaea CBS 101466]ETN40500.1 hypothetical protein HMPREF1541_04777 [Cyphellophora europaea CBS 101466]